MPYNEDPFNTPYWGTNNSRINDLVNPDNYPDRQQPRSVKEEVHKLHPSEILACLRDNTLVKIDIPDYKIGEVRRWQTEQILSKTCVNDYHQYLMSATGVGLKSAASNFIHGTSALRNVFIRNGLSPHVVDNIAANTRILKNIATLGKGLGNAATLFCVLNAVSDIEKGLRTKDLSSLIEPASDLVVVAYTSSGGGGVVGLVVSGCYLLIKLNIRELGRIYSEEKERRQIEKIRTTGYIPYALDSHAMYFNQGY